MNLQEFRKLIREEALKAINENNSRSIQKEGIFDALKNLLQKKKKEAPKSSPKGKRIVGMDFDGYYIDEDGNRV